MGQLEPRMQQGAFVAPYLVRFSRWSCFLCMERKLTLREAALPGAVMWAGGGDGHQEA